MAGSKFELVHRPDGEQIKHGERFLQGVKEVEKVVKDGVPVLVIKAELGSEVFSQDSKFVLVHGEELSLSHEGVALEGVESIKKELGENGKPYVVIEAVLAGEDYSALVKKEKPEAKKPVAKPVATPKPTDDKAE